ncbi:MAG: trypco2 family protein [Pseudomonadota bacterium]
MANNSEKNPPDNQDRLSLEDALSEIRHSLLEASETARKDGRGAVLHLDSAELEVKFTAGRVAKAGGKFAAKFWVIDAGVEGGGEVASELIHTLRLKFVPAYKNTPAPAGTIILDRPTKSTEERISGHSQDTKPYILPSDGAGDIWRQGTTFYHDTKSPSSIVNSPGRFDTTFDITGNKGKKSG